MRLQDPGTGIREPGEQGQANQDDGEAKANLAVPFHSSAPDLESFV